MQNFEKPLVISMGEPTGISPEIILKCWKHRTDNYLPPFAVVGDMDVLLERSVLFDLNVPIQKVSTMQEVLGIFEFALPVIHIPLNKDYEIGRFSSSYAATVLDWIKVATEFCFNGDALAMVTAPVQKENLADCDPDFRGHTDYIAEILAFKTGQAIQPIMMLTTDGLRVVPYTTHIPLRDVPKSLRSSEIADFIAHLHFCLRMDYGFENPRIAVVGLNPHAGDGGIMGDEDSNIITPAITMMQEQDMHVTGPHAADTMFHERARMVYDVALCMYHDQALIPIKTIDFEGTVNVTLGLPIIRTSPDHGTAMLIAKRGIASSNSLIRAIIEAVRIFKARKIFLEKNI